MVTSMKKMTETIYYMVTSSKNKEDNTIYMMSSVTEIVSITKIEMAVTVSTEEIQENMIELVVASKGRISRYRNS